MKLKGITNRGMQRLAQSVDAADIGGADEDLRRQLNSIIDTLVEFRDEFDSDLLTELGRVEGEPVARAVVEAVWPALDAVYNYLEMG